MYVSVMACLYQFVFSYAIAKIYYDICLLKIDKRAKNDQYRVNNNTGSIWVWRFYRQYKTIPGCAMLIKYTNNVLCRRRKYEPQASTMS